MNKKLETKDIAGYLPHELQAINNNGDTLHIPFNCVGGLFNGVKPAKPILRPLSDLFETIMHNGKEVIPILELARLSVPKYNWKLFLQKEYERSHAFAESKGIEKIHFSYWNLNGSDMFTLLDNTGKNLCVPNQSKLFDYLLELKVDYRGLIDAGLAVSVYSLPENPYK